MSWNDETAALLKRGDPAEAVPADVDRRVAMRLAGAPPRRRLDLRWAVVLASLAGVGVLAANVVRHALTAPTPAVLQPVPVPSAPRPSPANVAPSTLAEEVVLLQRALAALERGDGRGALTALDEHAHTFPSGELVVETRVARVRALLLTGDDAGAIDVLRELPSFARTNALGVLEAQALARLHRCAEFREVVAGLDEPSVAGACHAP